MSSFTVSNKIPQGHNQAPNQSGGGSFFLNKGAFLKGNEQHKDPSLQQNKQSHNRVSGSPGFSNFMKKSSKAMNLQINPNLSSKAPATDTQNQQSSNQHPSKNNFFMSKFNNQPSQKSVVQQENSNKNGGKNNRLNSNNLGNSKHQYGTTPNGQISLRKSPSPPQNGMVSNSKRLNLKIKKSPERQDNEKYMTNFFGKQVQSNKDQLSQNQIQTSARPNKFDQNTVIPKKMIKIVKRVSPNASQSPTSFGNERCDISQSPDSSGLGLNRINAVNQTQKQTLPLKSINFVNKKNEAANDMKMQNRSPQPNTEIDQNSIMKQKYHQKIQIQNQNLRILNANLINLNPNAQPIISSRGEGKPNPNLISKKISLSNNVLKVLKKKSISPEGPKNQDAAAGTIKVSPVRGMLNHIKNQQNGDKSKVVLMRKIRKSPSPPSSDPLVINQEKVVSSRPALASDFIKNMMKSQNQKNTDNTKQGILSKYSKQEQIGQVQKLKIRRSPPRVAGQNLKISKLKNVDGSDALNFTTDMKRLGIMDAVQDVQETKKKLIIKQRHISPPPVLNSGDQNELSGSGEIINDYNDSKPIQKPNGTNGENQVLFKFPFQRRCRSLSLPKDKDGNDIVQTEQVNIQAGTFNSKNDYVTSKKDPAENQETTSNQYDTNKPIKANDNLLLAHKGLVPGVMKLIQKQQEQELIDGKHKEVDEWLMGSGESAETAASKQEQSHSQIGTGLLQASTKNNNKIVNHNRNPEITQTTEIDTQLTVVESTKQTKQEDDNDDTTWMFRTFSKTQTPQQAVENKNHGHINISVPDENYQPSAQNLDEFMQDYDREYAPDTNDQYANQDFDYLKYLLN